MDFLAPPEVTSALIHSGPGAESLIEAAGAWQRLSTELENAATSYASVLSPLTAAWNGPSSSAMVQAVEPYVTWLRTTAQQAQQTAASAQAAAAAFSSVRSAVVYPAQVSANRTQLAQLLATNLLGRNLAAIAATEAQYESMWANNSAAMSRYQVASAQAATLPQLSSPPAIANPSGLAAQASVVPAATAASSALPAATAAASAAPAAAATDPLSSIVSTLGLLDPTTGYVGLANTWGNQFIASGFPVNMLSLLAQVATAQGIQNVGGEVGTGLAEGEAALGPSALGQIGAGLGLAPAATMGAGVSIGKLTAPPAVVGILPASQAPVQLASAASPLPPGESGLPFLPPLMPPPITAGSGWRKRKQQKYEDLEYGLEVKGTVIPKPPSAG
jgi:PPE-repeat protein